MFLNKSQLVVILLCSGFGLVYVSTFHPLSLQPFVSTILFKLWLFIYKSQSPEIGLINFKEVKFTFFETASVINRVQADNNFFIKNDFQTYSVIDSMSVGGIGLQQITYLIVYITQTGYHSFIVGLDLEFQEFVYLNASKCEFILSINQNDSKSEYLKILIVINMFPKE